MGATKLSTNRKTTRTQVGGYDIVKWNDADVNEDGIAIDNHADHIDPLDISVNTLYEYNPIQDASILNNFIKTNIIDSSISSLKNYDAVQDASILIALGTAVSNYDKVQDVSIIQHLSDILDVSSRVLGNENSVIRIDAYDAIQDVSILGNVAKSGDSMTGDLSINSYLYTQAVQFDASIIDPLLEAAGLTWWNKNELALNIATGIGPVLQVGQEIYILIFNDTGAQIDNATILRPKAATFFQGQIIPTVEKAKADVFSTVEGTIMASTMDIPDNTIGLATRFGRVRGSDTTHLIPGADAFVSDTSAGTVTNTRPSFPSYAIKIGAALNSSTNGDGIISISTNISDTFNDFHNGTFREPFSFDVSSNGTDMWGILTPKGINTDMTMMFSDGFTLLDTSPDASLDLTPGTDTNPQTNYIYITKANKILESSISDWPTGEEHIKISQVFLQSASAGILQTSLRNHNWNDPIEDIVSQGHLSHITERMRLNNPKWHSGVLATAFVNTIPTPDDVFVSNDAGVVYQMHRQNFNAFDTSIGDHIHVINHFTTPYLSISNLNVLLSDATGTTLNNTAFSFVLWGAINSQGDDHLMLNLPTGSYPFITPSDAVNDISNHAVYDIPLEFEGVGFLIARFTFTYKNDEWVLYDTEDLRGNVPNSTAGGGGGGAGVTAFTELTDTPSAYLGNALNLIQINAGENALEFVDSSTISFATSGTPADSSTTGVEGTFQYDASYFYVCTSTNTWGRTLLETF